MRTLLLFAIFTASCGERPLDVSRSRGRAQSFGDSDRASGDADPEQGDAAETPAGDDAVPGDSAPQATCGNATLEAGETCDDGLSTFGCDIYHDGGDGTCVPPGSCSVGYVIDGTDCVPASTDQHVHIYVDNFCNLWVDPAVVEVPPTQHSVSFVYHNHSVDYDVDVWLSYGGGYLELLPGTSWDDAFDHCAWASRPYDAYADISISGLGVNDQYCPGHRMLIHCR